MRQGLTDAVARAGQIAGGLPPAGEKRLCRDVGVHARHWQTLQGLLGKRHGAARLTLEVGVQAAQGQEVTTQGLAARQLCAGHRAVDQRLDAVHDCRDLDMTPLVIHQPGLHNQQFGIALDSIGRQQPQTAIETPALLAAKKKIAMPCQQLPGRRPTVTGQRMRDGFFEQTLRRQPGCRPVVQFGDVGRRAAQAELPLQELPEQATVAIPVATIVDDGTEHRARGHHPQQRLTDQRFPQGGTLPEYRVAQRGTEAVEDRCAQQAVDRASRLVCEQLFDEVLLQLRRLAAQAARQTRGRVITVA